VASFAGEGSPFNKIAGLGFAGVPGPAALDEIEEAFAACGSPVQAALAHLADPAIGTLLTGRGYRLESFENVLVLDPAGNVVVSVYSSGAIGRLVPDDVVGLVRYLREHSPAPGRRTA
jgi:hypothetical protein